MNLLKAFALFSLNVGKCFGIPIYIHWTLLVMFLLIGWFTNVWVLLFSLSAFLIILLHELGHCYAVKKYGEDVEFIILLPIGGVAMIHMKYESKKELVVAAAGPLVNVALIPIFAIGLFLHKFFVVLFVFNLFLLLFNLLPAFPLDGGRMMRSALTLWTGNFKKSTLISIIVGFIFGLLFIFGGLLLDLSLSLVGLMILYYCEVERNRLKEVP